MKHLTASILLFMSYQVVCGQTNPGSRFFETDSKSHLYYVDLNEAVAQVYSMGPSYDKVGYGSTKESTLQRQLDSSYSSGSFRIVHENDGLYLVQIFPRNRKFRLNAARDTNLVNNHLNNAWYLSSYFMMCKKLNHLYPLNYLDYGDAPFTWKALPEDEKNMRHLQFKVFTHERFKELSDSISAVQEKYVRLTNYIVENIHSLDYAALRDSLVQLPAEYMGKSKYYGTVIDTVALQRPEYFFRLAEDLPQHKSLIFNYGVDNRKAFAGLVNVDGHDEIKKDFLKERKSQRALGYLALGATALGFALVGYLAILTL